jgi:L-galactose dehydrogenase
VQDCPDRVYDPLFVTPRRCLGLAVFANLERPQGAKLLFIFILTHTFNMSTLFKQTVQNYLLQLPQGRVRYGIGCAWLGTTADYRETLKEDLLTLETAFRLGFRYFDTAPHYRNSEFTVGEFVAQAPRESIFLATKFNLSPQATPREAAEHVRRSLAESLRRLKTDSLDLYQVHDVDSLANVLAEGGALEVLLEAKRQGIVRLIGVATRWHWILEEAARSGQFDTVLTYSDYTPFNRTAGPLIELANALEMGVINASPLSGTRKHGLDLHDRGVLAATLQFPLTNPGIDINLTGPGNSREIQASFEALQASVDPAIWDTWQSMKLP